MTVNHSNQSKFHFILLGASNLARARFGLNQYLEKSFPNLISTSIASGPGRAYCVSGGIFGLNYPPLKSSAIINLGREKNSSYRQTIALISDIGNDIMYGVPIQTLIEELEKSIRNLSNFCAHIFIVPIPCKKIEGLSDWQINFLKKILFPKCKLTPKKIINSIQTANQFLSELSNPKTTLLKPMDDCIGWDRAHYDISKMHIAWTKIVEQITQELSIKPSRNINHALMFRSYIEYWKNLIFCDAVPLLTKDRQAY